MPWWSWVVIWGVLVLLTLAMLAWLAVRLFRKLMGTFEALGDLADQVGELGANVETLAPGRTAPAIFADRAALAAAIHESRLHRATARQARRDARIKRGRLLQRAPVSQRTPPNA